MSATRPATEFSIGIIASRAAPSRTAANASSNARQAYKTVERGAAIGVEPDMLVMRPLAPRHRRLAEIESARRPRRVGEPGRDLVDAGVGERGGVGDHGGEG